MVARMARLVSLTIGIAAAAGGARAEGIVLSSTAPGMTVGRVIADDETVRLPDGSLTTLLLPTGQVLTLTGPYDGKAIPGQAPTGSRVGGLMADWKGLDLSALGGTRGELLAGVSVPDATAPLTVDAAGPGTWCVAPETPLRLKGPAAGGPAALRLEDAKTGAAAVVSWQSGAEQPWPPDLPVRDGTTILARWQDAGPAHPIRFHVAPDDGEAADLRRVVSWALSGCYRQAAPYLREVGAHVAPFELFLSTNRGRTPRYAIGENLTLILQSNRAAQLYCFVLRDGSITPLFTEPPGFLPIEDHSELRIPGERVAIEIAALPPPGVGEVRCYAVDHAAAGKAGLNLADGALTDPTGQPLDRLFAALPEGKVARAALHVRID